MIIGRVTKQPAETESYTDDLSQDLDVGETVTNATAAVYGADALLTVAAISFTTTAVQFFATGGTDQVPYSAELTITTSTGRVLVDEVVIQVAKVVAP
jgi:hypothetical protein